MQAFIVKSFRKVAPNNGNQGERKLKLMIFRMPQTESLHEDSPDTLLFLVFYN
jgi:hypothetical protein